MTGLAAQRATRTSSDSMTILVRLLRKSDSLQVLARRMTRDRVIHIFRMVRPSPLN
jgi:hypothetical protein